jgi:hypothetical protein
MAGIHFTTQEKQRNPFTIFTQFIVSLSAPALTHCISTTLKWVGRTQEKILKKP